MKASQQNKGSSSCMFQNLLEDFDDIVLTAGTAGSASGIAIANYLTGSKLK